MIVYDRGHGDTDVGVHPFTDCDCGSQVHYIDTVDMSTVESECFVLFWYDPEKGLQVAQHMGISVRGLELLCEMMARIIEGTMKSLGGDDGSRTGK